MKSFVNPSGNGNSATISKPVGWERIQTLLRTQRTLSATLLDAIRQRASEDEASGRLTLGSGNQFMRTARTSRLQAARDLVAAYLPDWFVCSGTCDLSGHASIGPDYNSKEPGVRERLLEAWRLESWGNGVDSDLLPGTPDREAMAVLHCLAKVMVSLRSPRSAPDW